VPLPSIVRLSVPGLAGFISLVRRTRVQEFSDPIYEQPLWLLFFVPSLLQLGSFLIKIITRLFNNRIQLMLNMNFDKPVVIQTTEIEWEASPMSGVWRKPLAREAAEHGHTTSVVRYDAGSHFPEHPHPKGEEILVLEGVFSDEHGNYPTGTYIRNAPGSKHSPFSKEGCVLLVKLDQFEPDDDVNLRIDTRSGEWLPAEDDLQVMPMHYFSTEMVALYRWPANGRFPPQAHFGGEEFFVLSGLLQDEFGSYPAGSWVRNPHNSEHSRFVEEDTIIWIKTGHLLPK
jgi:anti-sigma factor ChrR (cupin superfamily)